MDKELIILAIYIDVNNLSNSRSNQIMQNVIKQYETMYDSVNKDIKVYWFPSNETKVECIYPPVKLDSATAENELLKIYKLLLSSQPKEAKEMVQNIERKLKLQNLKKTSK
jgi:hypothetical protein